MKLRFLAAAIMLVFAGAVLVLTGGPLAEGAAAQAVSLRVFEVARWRSGPSNY